MQKTLTLLPVEWDMSLTIYLSAMYTVHTPNFKLIPHPSAALCQKDMHGVETYSLNPI